MKPKDSYYKYCRHCDSVYSNKEKVCTICQNKKNMFQKLLRYIKKEHDE